MSAICYIIGSYPLGKDCPFSPNPDDFIIAADGGYVQLKARNITPSLIIGDFDSSPSPTNRTNVIVLPVEKDDTDIGCAIHEGLSRGYTNFAIYGGFGGLFDHTFANLQHLLSLSRQNTLAILVGDRQCATVVTNGTFSLQGEVGARCSVFAFGGEAHGVTIDSAYYTVKDVILSPTVPLGVSNSFLDKPIQIEVKDGSLLVIWEYTPDVIENFFENA